MDSKEKSKMVNLRVPVDLLEKMKEYREQEGATLTFQFLRGVKLFHDSKK